MAQPTITTLGDLKKSGYQSKTVKQELRDNLIDVLKSKKNIFEGIQGYEETVLPQLQSSILSKHNIILLGLRGQAKTRIARLLTSLMDEYVPIVSGSELNDDPLQPLSHFARTLIEEKGDATPISWLHRNERYSEKLATPDVSISDLIGDVDPIKAANQKLTFADERVIHFGMIPRAHRGLFVINELPDLQPRIQVALFNILQEGDIQVRGFKLRFPLDVQFVFTANPEDYTNRGSIITPLKDRIESQILTHYPKTLELSKAITEQEADLSSEQREKIIIPELISNLVERIALEARESEYVDQKSGVSARLTISAYELLHSTIERRMLINGEKTVYSRVSDLFNIIPAITGKIELVYEGELEGMASVAYHLIGKAIRKEFELLFPNPEKVKKLQNNPYRLVLDYFNIGKHLDIDLAFTTKEYQRALNSVPGLASLIDSLDLKLTPDNKFLLMEFALNGLAEFSQLSRQKIDTGMKFQDIMGGINLDMNFDEED